MQTTFPRLLLDHATQRPGDAAMREKEYGIWQAITWADLAVMVEHLACGLHQAGLRQHDHMVVIGANRPRLYATMLAVQALGAVPIALYQDAAAPECVFPINNAEVRLCLCRRPGAGGQAAGDSRPVPATCQALLRRPARPAQLRRAGSAVA